MFGLIKVDYKGFVTNVPYTRYIPKAANFEALCDECVTSNRPVHTYFDDARMYTEKEAYYLRHSECRLPD